MAEIARIEQTLSTAVDGATGPGCPPLLAAGIRHAVFPGGARIRPKLCLAVAHACGEDAPKVTNAAAAAIELLHCASLVHDDLPCFDNSPLRRGQPSVHTAFGERIAVLTGDALIVLAFETLTRGAAGIPARLTYLLGTLSLAVGTPAGLCAGQAWECEDKVSLSDYHRSKTGALFLAACTAGAQAAGAEAGPWSLVGEWLGEAYQVADDLRDALCDVDELGKPAKQDALLGRPNAVEAMGVAATVQRMQELVAAAADAVPDCPGAGALRMLIANESQRILPSQLSRAAA